MSFLIRFFYVFTHGSDFPCELLTAPSYRKPPRPRRALLDSSWHSRTHLSCTRPLIGIGLQTLDVLDERLYILGQLRCIKAQLANNRMDNARRVVAELHLPALYSCTTFATSGVTVPARGDGIRPRGPSTCPSGPTRPIMSGDAMQASKSVQPSLIFLARSSWPTSSAPASLAAVCQIALGKHHDALRPANAMRQDNRTADDLIGLLGIDPQPHRDFDRLVELGRVELPTAPRSLRPAARARWRPCSMSERNLLECLAHG